MLWRCAQDLRPMRLKRTEYNNSMQLTALRASADAGRKALDGQGIG